MLRVFFLFLVLFCSTLHSWAQLSSNQSSVENFQLNYTEPQKFEIADITISGARFVDPTAIIAITGLNKGDNIKIPGDDISRALKNLWNQGILGDIKVSITKVEGNRIWLDFFLQERPRLSKFIFKGIKKSEEDDLKEKIRLIKGKVVTDVLVKNTQNNVKKYFVEKGYLNTVVTIQRSKDTVFANNIILIINVNKKHKVKIDRITFTGNEVFGSKVLKKKMKKTKEVGGKFLGSSKFKRGDYEEDKKTLITFYNSKGYRDALITHDSIYSTPHKSWGIDANGLISKRMSESSDRRIAIDITVYEGKKYYFRNIDWVGNFVHTDNELASILAIKKGEVYNMELLESRLNYNPNGQDVSSLYLDDGYLFFSVDPVEVHIDGDSIDIEMRMHEGAQATISKITISGNTKTNDHVILRELRTVPGRKFSRSDLIRSQRELSTLGYFDPEKIQINPIPNPATGTVDIDYNVTEKPSDQIQLSGGYGGYFGLTGTLGVVFNNFSLRNIPHLHKWDPLPSGDGQRLSLSLQANGPNYQSYSASFTEPWLGGTKPHALTVSFNKSNQRTNGANYLPDGNGGYSGDPYGHLRLNSVTVGLGRRLKWPDDYFTLNNSIAFLNYNLVNYSSGLIPAQNGVFNSLALSTTLARNSIDNPTYPRRGASISLALTVTPPYSLFAKPMNYDGLSDQDKYAKQYKKVEYYKTMFDCSFFTRIAGNLVLNTRAHFGFLGAYNNSIGIGPFERFVMGGSGLSGFNYLLGSDVIGLRGYQDNSIGRTPNSTQGGVAYDKLVFELRYPITLNPMATIFVVGFAEGGNNAATYADYDPLNLYRSMGMGARIFMPAFGLIGVDYGWALDKVPGYPTANQNHFTFTIGQQLR